MKAQELRIGNYVWHTLEKDHEHKNYTHRVQTISVHQEKPECVLVLFGYFPPCTIDFIEPIPLTEEWLVRFGFYIESKVPFKNENSYVSTYKLRDFMVYSRNNESFNFFKRTNHETPLTYIKSVHSLQNLYFALTGEELEIKNP